MTETWINSSGSSVSFIYLLIVVLLTSKIYYRYYKNKKVHKKLSNKHCPYCGEINNLKDRLCVKCGKTFDKNQQNVVCLNCGYLGEMENYSKNGEFVVTLMIWAILTFPALIYFLFYRNRKICKNCGRMTRKSDWRDLGGSV